MKLLKTAAAVLGGGAVGYGLHLYKEMMPAYEVKLIEDPAHAPFVRLVRDPDFTYGGHVGGKSKLSIKIHNTLISELNVPGEECVAMTGSTVFDSEMKNSQIDKDMFVMLDTMMGGSSAFYLRKKGTMSGTATSYIDVARSGDLYADVKYNIAILSESKDGKNFYTKGIVADDKGKIVRTYRGRFVKVPWTTRVLIKMQKLNT